MKFVLFLVFHLVFFAAETVWALCAAPAGAAGQVQWIPADGKVKWCDGAAWIDPTIGLGLNCTGSSPGEIKFASGDLSYCDGSAWQSMAGPQVGVCPGLSVGTLKWNGSVMTFCDGFFWRAMYAAAVPEMTTLTLNGGSPITANNSVNITFGASVTDSGSKVTEFCLKYSASAAIPSAPGTSDPCWIPVNNPSPGVTPSAAISFTNFYFLLGYSPSNYTVYSWVKSGSNLISTLSAAGLGTDGVDRAIVNFQPNPPPVVVNVVAASSDSPSAPLTSGDITVASGASVYIKWKATAISGLTGTPMSLYYTTDEVNFILLQNNLANAADTGCTVDGLNHTGCFRWLNGSPTSAYFRIRVVAVDDAAVTAFSLSGPLNTGSFRTIAGNTDRGLGGSAASAIIFNYVNNLGTDAKSFVYANDGTVYVRDSVAGILKIDPNDGKLQIFIPFTGTITDGAIGVATLGSLGSRLTMDFQGNLLIYDSTRIRRVDLSTNQVTTLIGGGGLTASGTPALSFDLSCDSIVGANCPITAAPNGDIYFLREFSHSGSPSGGYVIRKYDASDGKVYSIVPGGTGLAEIPMMPLANATLSSITLEFDTSAKTISKFYGNFREVPCSGCGFKLRPAELNQTTWESTGGGYSVPPHGTYNDQTSITAMDGKIYLLSFGGPRLMRYNSGADTWTTVVGNGTIGRCADGTPAASCSVFLQDAFVTAQGQIFLMDNGLIRTVDENQEIKTLFGQARSYGNGGLAVSARFNLISSITESTSGKIAILDANENLLREFTDGGNITNLIGDGRMIGTTSGGFGVSQPIPGGYWGNQFNIIFDSFNDDLFFTAQESGAYRIFQYERSSGKIYSRAGGGATSFISADGLVGSDVKFDGYPIQLLGFDGTKLVGISNKWDGSAHRDAFFKFYDKSDSYRQSTFAGILDFSINSYSPDTTPLSAAQLPLEFGNRNMTGTWDSVASTWLFISLNVPTVVRTLPPGGNLGTAGSLPRAVTGWTMVRNGSSHRIFYYCSAGLMYKYNMNTASETTLAWPSSTISCTGTSVVRSAVRNSIVFPYKQNGLVGVAEIVDTP